MLVHPRKQGSGFRVYLVVAAMLGIAAEAQMSAAQPPASPVAPAANQPGATVVRPSTPDVSGIGTPNVADVSTPSIEGLDTPDFGQLDTPDFGDLRSPDFSDLNIPNFNNLNTPDFSNLDTPDFSDLDTPDFSDLDVSPVDDTRPISPFISPEESTGNLGAAIPLVLDLRSTVLADQGANLGLILNTLGNQLIVVGFDEDSLIAPAGLFVGDQILAVERHVISSFDQFGTALTTAIARDGRAWVLVLRDGRPVWVSLDLARRMRPTLGVNTTLENGSVIISHVSTGSAADLAGLQVGDIVLRVNHEVIHSHGELLDAIFLAATTDGRLEIVVIRDRRPLKLIADIDQLKVAARPDNGPDPMSGIASEEVSEELADEGLTVAAGMITSVSDAANALLTATEGIAAQTEGPVHTDAQALVILARDVSDKVREIDGNSAADLQATITDLVATANKMDQRLTTLAVQALGEADAPLAEARVKVGELQEGLDAINASLTDDVPMNED